MDDLRNAIQDAQFIGAVMDPVPRPTRPLPTLPPHEMDSAVGRVTEANPTAFSFENVVTQPLGYFLVRS